MVLGKKSVLKKKKKKKKKFSSITQNFRPLPGSDNNKPLGAERVNEDI